MFTVPPIKNAVHHILASFQTINAQQQISAAEKM